MVLSEILQVDCSINYRTATNSVCVKKSLEKFLEHKSLVMDYSDFNFLEQNTGKKEILSGNTKEY